MTFRSVISQQCQTTYIENKLIIIMKESSGTKRMRSGEVSEPPQPLIDALDSIINPPECFIEYSAGQVAEIKALKTQALECDSDLCEFHESISTGVIDSKLEPKAVQRCSSDKHYLMSILCINMGRLEELKPSGINDAIYMYTEALKWHSTSLEAGLRLGLILRHTAANMENLSRAEMIWRKSYDAAKGYNYFSHSRPRPSAVYPDIPFSSYNRMIHNREKKITKELADILILHFCQENKVPLATEILTTYRYHYKLSQNILCYPIINYLSISSPVSNTTHKDAKPSCDYACGVDSVLPLTMLSKMQNIFRPDSPFWSEHNYDFYSNASRSVGYFSYLFPYRELRPANIIEQAICMIFDLVSAKFPDIAKKSTIGVLQ